VLDQPLGEPLGTGAAHEGDESPGHARERCDVELLDVMRGKRRHGLRDTAVRHRDQRRFRHGRERRHTGNELEGDARIRKRERLLAAATEDERVAAFEPHDEVPAAVIDECAVHLRL